MSDGSPDNNAAGPQHAADEKHATHATLQGSIPAMASPQEREAALNQAFDYRGDVTITLCDNRRIEGYIFDRRGRGDDACVRLMPVDSDERLTVKYGDIKALEFSGRDTAAGKSWETWVKNYNEKKARGEAANLHPESLEE
jgi:hypothetical protein